MPEVVIDTSALAAMVYGEPTAEAVSQRLVGKTLVAPALLWFELANVCLKKVRHHPEDKEHYLACLAGVSRMGVDTREVDQVATVRLAEEARLSTYDASYLWLARHLGAELVTLDEKLAKVAAVTG